MEELLFDKSILCPVCNRDFTSKKVRSRHLRVLRRDDDLNIVYHDVEPLFYQIFICPHCGFSGFESDFKELTPIQKRVFDDKIRYKWKSRDFGGVRTPEQAETSYKMALLVSETLNRSRLYMGHLCIKIAWFYRSQGNPKEETYLKHALEYFESAYQKERIEDSNIDEITIAYLVAELHRRFGNFKEAIVWYAKVLDNPEIKNNRQLQIKTREQWRKTKEAYDLLHD